MGKFFNPWKDNFECINNKQNADYFEQRRKGLCLYKNGKVKRKKYGKGCMSLKQKNMMLEGM